MEATNSFNKIWRLMVLMLAMIFLTLTQHHAFHHNAHKENKGNAEHNQAQAAVTRCLSCFVHVLGFLGHSVN
jgi:hypothetical protein